MYDPIINWFPNSNGAGKNHWGIRTEKYTSVSLLAYLFGKLKESKWVWRITQLYTA